MSTLKALAIAATLIATIIPVKADAASGIGFFLPPAEFDKPYPGELTIQRVATERDVQDVCPSINFKAHSKRGPATACSSVNKDRSRCYIVIVSDRILKALRTSYAFALKHELGHCNGWAGDHKGGKLVPMETRVAMPTLPASTKYLPEYPPVVCIAPDWKPEPCDSRKPFWPEPNVVLLPTITVTQSK